MSERTRTRLAYAVIFVLLIVVLLVIADRV